jgi:hypothetical protein
MPPANPEYLYRYCSAKRAVQMFRENRLFLCPPADFNDLYEGSIARLAQYNPDAGLQLIAKIASIRNSISIDETRTMLKDRMPETETKRAFNDTAAWLREPAEKLRTCSAVTCFSLRRDEQE